MKFKGYYKLSFLTILFSVISIIIVFNNSTSENITQERVLLVPENFQTIQQAIDAALTGDYISIKKGIYFENLEFYSKTVSLISRSEPESTIIDGGKLGPVFFSWFPGDKNMTMKLKGLTFRNGLASNGSWPSPAITIYSSRPGISLTIDNCIIEENVVTDSSYYPPPSVLCFGTQYPRTVRISNTIIRNNSGGKELLAIFTDGLDENAVIMENCEIYGNQGNLFSQHVHPIGYFDNCIIRDNDGAAIASVNAKKVVNCEIINNLYGCVADTVLNCTIADNLGTGLGGHYVRNCLIKNNLGVGVNTNNIKDTYIFGNSGGGAYLSKNGLIENCVIVNNSSKGTVGGILMNSGSRIINSIIANNKSTYSGSGGYAGGILVEEFWGSDTTQILNCTIVSNESKGRGAGVSLWSPFAYEKLVISNCIISSNKGGYGISSNTFTGFMDEFVYNTYNDLWNNELGNYDPWGPPPGIGEFSLNPLFVGGKHNDLHLRGSSPCIDRGIDVGVYVDIEGDLRPFGSGFDMGADEWTGAGSRR